MGISVKSVNFILSFLFAALTGWSSLAWAQDSYSKLAVGAAAEAQKQIECANKWISMYPDLCDEDLKVRCEPRKRTFLGSFLLYPGLTPLEQELVRAYPFEALKVFKLKVQAEKATEENFPDQGFNDESDAFRHFLWSALLTKELGPARARLYLDAHEKDAHEPSLEKNMDYHNNKVGQAAAIKMIQNNQFDFQKLKNMGLALLRQNQLIVVRKALVIPEVAI